MDATNQTHSSMVDLSQESIHWDLRDKASYGAYLCIPQLLDCQKPVSTAHDEMMFIIIHQQAELWMKLSIYEISNAMDSIKADKIDPALKMLARQATIQKQLIMSWDVLATLTPADYLKFRDELGTSSGFQSHQYRLLEFMLGNKNSKLMDVHKTNPEHYRALTQALHQPSLYDEVIALLVRRGFRIQGYSLEQMKNNDWQAPTQSRKGIEAAWLEIYTNPSEYWDLYYLAEKLMDIEDQFQQWRFRHMKTVERIIGFRRGTGGSSGVDYLQKALSLRFFPELWSLRTEL